MSRTRLGLAFAALVVAFILLAIWLARQQEASQQAQAQAQRLAIEAASAASFEERAARAIEPSENAAATPLSAQPANASAPSTGRLVVKVTRARDGQPVADSVIFVQQTSRLYWYADLLEGRTGPDGTWTLDPAPLGLLRVIETRGDSQPVRINADETVEVLLHVRKGATVSGTVTDQGDEPVPGAELWLFDNQTSPHGRLVAHADSAGRFVLEDLYWQYLGARAAGHAPSAVVSVEQAAMLGEAVRLRLRGPGGRVMGRVTDAAGQPLAGAIVVVGPNAGISRGPWGDGPPSFLVRAAADGSWSVSDVPAGTVPLAAALEGRSPWTSSVALGVNQALVADIVLQPGATIAGTVRDAAGASVANASVWIGSSDTVFDRVQCSSDELGRYELRSLPLGEQSVRASHDEAGRARHALVVVAGEHSTWDPQLDLGRRFVGRVVGERDEGLPGLLVFAQHVPRDDETRMASTQEGGVFAIEACDDGEYRLDVTDSSAGPEILVALEHARAGPDELKLVVPDGLRRESSVSGRLVDDLGWALPAPHVSISVTAPSDPGGDKFPHAAVEVDRVSGAFSIDKLGAGDYVGFAHPPDWYPVTIPINALQLGEHRELGALVFPSPGRLRVELVLPEGVAPEEVSLRVEPRESFGATDEMDAPAKLDQPLVRRSEALDPREDCELWAWGPSVLPRRLKLRPLSGRDTVVPLALERGVRVELGFRLGPAARHVLDVSVVNDAGITVVKARPEVAHVSEATPTTAWLGLGLATGSYVLQLRHNGGAPRVAALEVPKDAGTSLRRVIEVP